MIYFMEWCETDMKRYCQKHSDKITEKETKKWAKQLIEALVFLKDVLNTTHRDLKLDNIMLDSK